MRYFFFPALPSERGAWSGQLCRYAKAKRVKLEKLAGVFSLAEKKSNQRHQKQQNTKQNKKGAVKILVKVVKPARPFFFGQCCARCNNCGSHEVMLYYSSVDNTIAQIGQRIKKKKQKQTKPPPTNKHKPTKRDQSMKAETSETCSLSLPGA